MNWKAWLFVVLCWVAGWAGNGQVRADLAITEVMSSATTNLGPAVVAANSDWWELTNFGTNRIDLTGYKWNDNQGGLIGADPTPFVGLFIDPGESVVFFQSTLPASTNAAQFRAWWGIGLSAKTQLIPYLGNGLSSLGDGVRLWGADAVSDGDLIDSVDFDAALRGHSFVYDPSTGFLNRIATNGVGGVFKADQADDYASPGIITGPVPLSILTQPSRVAVNAGDTAEFSVSAQGLPRPRYQWFFRDAPIEGAHFRVLRIPNVQIENLGDYSVRISNGLETLISSNAPLILNAAPAAPTWVQVPGDLRVFVNQSVTFTATASGVPQPVYFWEHDGTPLSQGQESSFKLFSAALEDAGHYVVVASNALGQITHSVSLEVTRRPKLVITEIMPSQNTNGPTAGHNDWWELTNFDDFTVDMTGYRFDDSSAQLAAAITLTNSIHIAPGESIVFVENSTPEEFRAWWGMYGIQTNVQIISYRGPGLSLSSLGDAINLWNQGATEDFDTIASEVFSTATMGASFGYDLANKAFGGLSFPGVQGAWTAWELGDVGSPGTVQNPVEPRLIRYERASGHLHLQWTTFPDRNYVVQSSERAEGPTWTDRVTLKSSGTFLEYDVDDHSNAQFYRIALKP